MAGIDIRLFDPRESAALGEQVAGLVSKELGSSQSLDEILDTIDFGTGQTVLVGGFEGQQLVTMNAFIPQTFWRASERILAFQSGFSATHGDHRGKGLWPRLLIESEQILARNGGSFIFGYPNPVSGPLFVKKLQYASSTMFKRRLFVFPGILRIVMRSPGLPSEAPSHIRPDQREALARKRRGPAADTIVCVDNESGFAWGKLRHTRRLGLSLPYVELGGLEAEPTRPVGPILEALCQQAKVRLCFVSLNEQNEWRDQLPMRVPGQPVIVKPLGDFDATAPINFFDGLKDTF